MWEKPGQTAIPSSPKLTVLSRDGMALLKLSLENGSTIKVLLDGRHTRVLLALNGALWADRGLEEELRGWMADDQIAEAVAAQDEHFIATSAQTIAAYRSQIFRLIRDATPLGLCPPALFVTKRCLGVRLVQEIVIDRVHERDDSAGPGKSP